MEYEPDQRHPEIIAASTDLKDSKPLTTPGPNEDKDGFAIRSESELLQGKKATEYSALQ